MPQQDDLFQLIRSLTSSEKRYFKVNASKGGDAKSNYMQLFEAIDGQNGDDYDEEKLKTKYAKKPFIKYLSAEKKQLREQIMRHMRSYHASRSVNNQIYDLLQDECFYRGKGLNDLREKALLKAKEIATKYERFHLLKEILKRQTGFVIEFEKKKLTEPVIELINEQKQLAIIQETELELETKNRELFSLYRAGADLEDQATRSRVEMLIAEVERYRPRMNGWFRLQISFERANSIYYQLHRNWPRSFDCTKREYELFQTYGHFKDEEAMEYKICLANLMARALSAKDQEWFEKATDEMNSVPVHSFNAEGEVFQNVYFLKHLFYINGGEFEKAEALMPTIEEGLVKYAAKINKARMLAFQFNIMIMYFLMHRFKEALKWAEIILEDKSEIKQHQRLVTTLLLPIIHFELGHVDLVDSMTRSAYRYLKDKKRLHDFERLVLKYLKGMPLSADQTEFKEKLDVFHGELKGLMDDPEVKTAIGMEEMRLWAKSHINGTTMYQQLKLQSGIAQ